MKVFQIVFLSVLVISSFTSISARAEDADTMVKLTCSKPGRTDSGYIVDLSGPVNNVISDIANASVYKVSIQGTELIETIPCSAPTTRDNSIDAPDLITECRSTDASSLLSVKLYYHSSWTPRMRALLVVDELSDLAPLECLL